MVTLKIVDEKFDEIIENVSKVGPKKPIMIQTKEDFENILNYGKEDKTI